MIEFRPIFFIIGILLSMLGVAMLVPAIADAMTNNSDWAVFLASSFVTTFVGGTLILTTRGAFNKLIMRQAFVLTTAAWVALAAFSALPFAFSNLGMSYTDAFFEAMSGITTTGSTVITSLDTAPPGILLWRALLQWLGGIGIIVMAIAILPLLQVGGMQLFRMESSDSSDKAFPRVAQISAATAIIYTLLTVVCAIALWAAGMTLFDAIAHAMTTIATGGFSTSDGSIGYFNSALIDWIVIVFMIMGSLPFVLYFAMIRGNPKALIHDTQVQWFLVTVVVSILVIVVWLLAKNDVALSHAVRLSAFNVVSIITGTGFASADYSQWGLLPVTAFFFFMFIGGCAGSTSCGIKIFRYQILFANARVQFRKLWQPNVIYSPRYNHKPIPDSVTDAVMSFFFLFALVFGVLALALSLIGLDFMTAVSGAASAIANVGPALGSTIGPSGTYAPLPDAAKWVLSAGMLLGRLELFTVLVLFSPAFWRA